MKMTAAVRKKIIFFYWLKFADVNSDELMNDVAAAGHATGIYCDRITVW